MYFESITFIELIDCYMNKCQISPCLFQWMDLYNYKTFSTNQLQTTLKTSLQTIWKAVLMKVFFLNRVENICYSMLRLLQYVTFVTVCYRMLQYVFKCYFMQMLQNAGLKRFTVQVWKQFTVQVWKGLLFMFEKVYCSGLKGFTVQVWKRFTVQVWKRFTFQVWKGLLFRCERVYCSGVKRFTVQMWKGLLFRCEKVYCSGVKRFTAQVWKVFILFRCEKVYCSGVKQFTVQVWKGLLFSFFKVLMLKSMKLNPNFRRTLLFLFYFVT